MTHRSYPFSAIIGQEALKTALLLNAVDPLIGGVLIRGHKGAGKSTAARALSALLPVMTAVRGCPYHCDPTQPDRAHDACREVLADGGTPELLDLPTPMVELPLSATEDRIVGTIDIASALKEGERRFEPGLLAAANRGILYVDEVNLLPDHLVDLLLDAAATGINIVERDGLRVSHPARFMLVGTMNPEEGELRPQFLDRFGLCVSVRTVRDPQQRVEIIRRRIAFEQDPPSFTAAYADEENVLREQISQARAAIREVDVPDPLLQTAVAIAVEADVQGHRTEITLIRAATALAALLEKPAVTDRELQEAARLVLPHRLAASPLDRPEDVHERIADLLARSFGERPKIASPLPQDAVDVMDNQDFPGAAAAGSMLFTYLKKKARSTRSNRTTALS